MQGAKPTYYHISDQSLAPFEPMLQEMDEAFSPSVVYDANPGPGEVPLIASAVWEDL